MRRRCERVCGRCEGGKREEIKACVATHGVIIIMYIIREHTGHNTQVLCMLYLC